MKRRDKRKRRKKRLAQQPNPSTHGTSLDQNVTPPGTVRVTRDSHGRMYIKAPDGSLRRGDKVDPEKLDWLSEGGG